MIQVKNQHNLILNTRERPTFDTSLQILELLIDIVKKKVESRNHFKNGAKLKSQTSREINIK